MTLSRRSIRNMMHEVAPGQAISEDAVSIMKIYIERNIKDLTIQASRILEWENKTRRQIGEKLRSRLAPRHIKNAIDDKYPGLKEEK